MIFMISLIVNFIDIILISLYKFFYYLDTKTKEKRLKLKWKSRGVIIGNNSKIMDRSIIHSPDNLVLGNNSIIGEFVHIWAGGNVIIGDNVLIAAHTMITSQTHDKMAKNYNDSLINQEVIIDDNVWIGGNATILPGVKIGKNSIIGAGSIVTKNIPKNQIWAGNPAKCIQVLDR